MNARHRQTLGIVFVAAFVAFLLALIPTCSQAAPAIVAIARINDHLILQLIDYSISCNGSTGAFLFDGAEKVDQTCNIKARGNGLAITFPDMRPQPYFFPASAFVLIPAN